MKRVNYYYCRHGETLFNKLGRMQGWCDSPLTEKGINDAKIAHDILMDVPFVHAYVSTSERTRDTADIILAGRNVPVTHTKLLKEISWGNLEGELLEPNLDEINRRRLGKNDWTDIGGENTDMVWKRIRTILKEIYDASEDGDNVLIVSHGAVFMQYFPAIFGMDRMVFFGARKKGVPPVPNGFVGSFVCEDGKYRLTSFYNDEELIEKLYGE